jgi:hypothetical protein
MKSYCELTMEERHITCVRYMEMLGDDASLLVDNSFEAYNEENECLDMDFDATTLECLG